MDFNLTEDQQAFAETARQFAQSELAPNAAKWDREHIFPKDTIKAAGELGFCGLYTPEEAGGLGLSAILFGLGVYLYNKSKEALEKVKLKSFVAVEILILSVVLNVRVNSPAVAPLSSDNARIENTDES